VVGDSFRHREGVSMVKQVWHWRAAGVLHLRHRDRKREGEPQWHVSMECVRRAWHEGLVHGIDGGSSR